LYTDPEKIDAVEYLGEAITMQKSSAVSQPVEQDKLFDDVDKFTVSLDLLKHLESQVSRTDTKAQFTLTVDALLIGSATFFGKGVAHSLLSAGTPIEENIIAVLSIIMFAALLVSTYLALIVIMPKLSPPDIQFNIFYFSSILKLSEQDFITRYKNTDHKELENMLLSEIYAMAEIVQNKYKGIRKSHLFILVALGCWAFAQGIEILLK
jgi:Pycsar effector protein